jgi:hypothetical protein
VRGAAPEEDQDRVAQDLAKLKAPPEVIAAWTAQDRESVEAIEILPECWPAVELFVACSTQWRVGGMGVPIGLDYAGVRAAMALSRVRPSRELFEDVRVMERAALQELSSRA